MFLNFISTAIPPYKVSQQRAGYELKKRMGVKPSVGRLIDSAITHSGIESRYIVIPDAEDSEADKFYSKDEDYFKPDTESRMRLYEKWSKILAADSVDAILNKTNCDSGKIKRLITISCTGFFAPGIDYYLIDKFKFSENIKRTNIGFMGCAASIIGFNSVLESAVSLKEDESVLLVSIELCSIHLHTEPTRDNILANIIFADGCATALFSKSKLSPGTSLFLLSTDSVLFPESQALMGWNIGNYGFEMILSSDIPKIILNKAVPKLKEILYEKGLNISDIKFWALHPGGRAVLDVLQEGLSLQDDELYFSRKVLREYGNMSSVSILYILKEIINSGKLKSGDYCVAVAFGPGLTMEAALFKSI